VLFFLILALKPRVSADANSFVIAYDRPCQLRQLARVSSTRTQQEIPLTDAHVRVSFLSATLARRRSIPGRRGAPRQRRATDSVAQRQGKPSLPLTYGLRLIPMIVVTVPSVFHARAAPLSPLAQPPIRPTYLQFIMFSIVENC
jgi:hypothetical protein